MDRKGGKDGLETFTGSPLRLRERENLKKKRLSEKEAVARSRTGTTGESFRRNWKALESVNTPQIGRAHV